MFFISDSVQKQQLSVEESVQLIAKILQQEQSQMLKVGAQQKKKPMSTKGSQIKKQKSPKQLQQPSIKFLKNNPLTQEEYLQIENAANVQQFSLSHQIFLGKVLKVTDGDTVKIAIKLSNQLTKFTFRLDGIDTPESRSGEVKQYGQYVKEVLRRMIEGKIVRVQAGQFDKYGRVLAKIYAFGQNQEFCVNQFLIQNDLAKAYSGKTKQQFTKKDYNDFKQKYIQSSWPDVKSYPRAIFNSQFSKK